MSPFERPATAHAHIRYNKNGKIVDPPTRMPQKVGKLLTRRGPARTRTSYKVSSGQLALIRGKNRTLTLGERKIVTSFNAFAKEEP